MKTGTRSPPPWMKLNCCSPRMRDQSCIYSRDELAELGDLEPYGMVVEEEEPWLEVILAEGEVVMEGVEVAVMVVYAQEAAAAVPGKVLEDSFVPD